MISLPWRSIASHTACFSWSLVSPPLPAMPAPLLPCRRSFPAHTPLARRRAAHPRLSSEKFTTKTRPMVPWEHEGAEAHRDLRALRVFVVCYPDSREGVDDRHKPGHGDFGGVRDRFGSPGSRIWLGAFR